MPQGKNIGEIVIEYLKKYPTSSSLSLAKLLYRDYPEIFKDSEHARTVIRYYRGALGSTNRNKLTEEDYHPRISIPESDEFDYSPYILTEENFPILLGSDAHLPYHNQDALEIFFEYGYKNKAKTIIFNGDWLDMYQVSKFCRDPRNMSPAKEIEMLKKVMKDVRAMFPKAKLVYKLGNHEERWDNYMMTHAPEIFGITSTHLDNILKMDQNKGTVYGFDKLKIDIVGDKQLIKAGHLYIIHGHEYVFSIQNPVSPARGLYLKAKKSAICGHFHQTSEHTEPAINGKAITCWSNGCLCALNPKYMPLNKWNLGFSFLTMNGEYYKVDNRKIVHNQIV